MAARRPSVRPLSAGLAICVVFYDNYKYGHKALCLEQRVRLSKLSALYISTWKKNLESKPTAKKIHYFGNLSYIKHLCGPWGPWLAPYLNFVGVTENLKLRIIGYHLESRR